MYQNLLSWFENCYGDQTIFIQKTFTYPDSLITLLFVIRILRVTYFFIFKYFFRKISSLFC